MYMTDVTKLSDGPVGALPCLRHAAPRSNLHACTVATLRLTYSDAAHTTCKRNSQQQFTMLLNYSYADLQVVQGDGRGTRYGDSHS